MAEQIIHLGIGPTSSLTPFITTGLEIGAVVEFSGIQNITTIIFRDKRGVALHRNKRKAVLFRDKKIESL